MYIFVDEAGAFQPPSRPNQVSCVAALVVPESFLRTLFRRFRRLVGPWKAAAGGEAKGSRLSEEQMASVIGTIRRFDVLLVSVAIDMGLHSDVGVTRHKEEQVHKIRISISEKIRPHTRDRLEHLASRIQFLPNQLYVQSVLLTKLVEGVLKASTLYYSQRIPRTLGAFSWRLDAKDLTVTNYEKLWVDVVGPFLQTQSLIAPLPKLVGADYSALQRFLGETSVSPEHLRARVTQPSQPFRYVDIDALMRDLKFARSHTSTGIQAVDMLAAAIRRACNGTLGEKGWKGLGRLMPTPERGAECVRFVALEDIQEPDVPYARTLHAWRRETRRMVT